MKPRIYADFNKLDHLRRAILVCRGTAVDLQRLKLQLVDGMEVTLYMTDDVDEQGNPDCLEVDAVIKYDTEYGHWVGEFDWDALGYRSEKSPADPEG